MADPVILICLVAAGLIIYATAHGVYMYGAWTLVDEAVCGVIVAVPWIIATQNARGYASVGPLMYGIIATIIAIVTAAFCEPWSILEVVVVTGLALVGVQQWLSGR